MISAVTHGNRLKIGAFIGVLATNFFWASNALLSVDATQTIEPLHLNFWRWVFALLFLIPFGYKAFSRHSYIRANLPWLGLLGVLGISTYNLLLYSASQGTTAINITLLTTLIPVSILFIGWLIMGKAPTKRQQLGICIGLLAALIIITRADPKLMLNLDFNSGDSVMVGAIIDWGLYSVLLLRLSGTIKQVELLLLLVIPGVLWLGLAEFLVYGKLPIALLFDKSNLLLFSYLGIFPAILSYVFWNNGVRVLGPTITGLSLYSQPVFGALLSWLFFDQILDFYHLIAALCIGVALLMCIIKAKTSSS